ncbi:MAG: DUF2887 domain-containing protein [Leptolyngbyaceae cyanobacterium]
MRTDSLFYALFQSMPVLLFELLERDSGEARGYQFKIQNAEFKMLLDRLWPNFAFLILNFELVCPGLFSRSSVSTRSTAVPSTAV